MAAPVFTWGLFVLVGVVGLLIGVLALAINESTRGIGMTLGVVLLLLMGAATALLFVRVRATPTPVNSPRMVPAPPVQLLPAEKPAPESDFRKEPASPLPKPAPPTPAGEATSTLPAEAVDDIANSPKPDWIDRPGHLQGTIYRVAATSGLFVTRAECEQAIALKLQTAVANYIDDYLAPDAATKLTIDADLIKSLQREEFVETFTSATVGPMIQLHALLEFDDRARSELSRRWHQTVVIDRLGKVAIGSGIVLGLLAVATGYLRLDLFTAGQYRGRLKLAAGAAILLLVTTAAVVVG